MFLKCVIYLHPEQKKYFSGWMFIYDFQLFEYKCMNSE